VLIGSPELANLRNVPADSRGSPLALADGVRERSSPGVGQPVHGSIQDTFDDGLGQFGSGSFWPECPEQPADGLRAIPLPRGRQRFVEFCEADETLLGGFLAIK
jgi:hypothetical protein